MDPRKDNCKSCGAPILWVRMESGTMMPLDFTPSLRGTIAIQAGCERAAVLNSAARAVFLGKQLLYTSHFATCPNAASHRKKEIETSTLSEQMESLPKPTEKPE